MILYLNDDFSMGVKLFSMFERERTYSQLQRHLQIHDCITRL